MKRIIKHIVFWAIILIFHITRSRSGDQAYKFDEFLPLFFEEHLTLLPLLIVASYFTADFLFPRYFYTKKFLLFMLFMLFSGTIFVLLMRAYLFYYFLPQYHPDYNNQFPKFFQFNIFQHTFYIYSTVAIVVMVKYVRRVAKIEEQKNTLEKQNISSELAMLRSQVSPHFLFNTLNNIHALINKDPNRASSSILELSMIMRFMLHDAKNESVLLEKEIEYLKSFIGLLGLRVENRNFINFEIDGSPSNILVSPMLFVPLIENAFKHGDKDSTSPGITVKMKINKQEIEYEVTNYIKSNPVNMYSASGIGLPNLKRRLELIYPNKHKLTINTIENKYIVNLTINL